MEELILAGFLLYALNERRDVDVAVHTNRRGGPHRGAEFAANAFGKQFEIIVRERTSARRV